MTDIADGVCSSLARERAVRQVSVVTCRMTISRVRASTGSTFYRLARLYEADGQGRTGGRRISVGEWYGGHRKDNRRCGSWGLG